MYIKDMFSLFFNALQIKIPFVLSNSKVYIISIYDIFAGLVVISILFMGLYLLVTRSPYKNNRDVDGKE